MQASILEYDVSNKADRVILDVYCSHTVVAVKFISCFCVTDADSLQLYSSNNLVM
jgi:hypothetical protein